MWSEFFSGNVSLHISGIKPVSILKHTAIYQHERFTVHILLQLLLWCFHLLCDVKEQNHLQPSWHTCFLTLSSPPSLPVCGWSTVLSASFWCGQMPLMGLFDLIVFRATWSLSCPNIYLLQRPAAPSSPAITLHREEHGRPLSNCWRVLSPKLWHTPLGISSVFHCNNQNVCSFPGNVLISFWTGRAEVTG